MLVFDLDDTLYLERDFAFSGYAHLDGIVAGETGCTGFGTACRRLFAAGERRRIFDRACTELGLPSTPERIAELVAAYHGHFPEIALCPDADRCLAAVSEPLGLITDGPEHMQRNKLAALRLNERIAHIRPTGAWPPGFGKPHPRAFEEMERLAAPGAQMIYVADNPAKDFVTPKARGWVTIQIRRDGGVHDPSPPDPAHSATAVITTLDALPPLLG